MKRKCLAIGIILLFLVSSIAISINAAYPNERRGNLDCYPIFTPTPGRNGWCVSPLGVSYRYDPEKVLEIQSWLNQSWVPYDGPFNITQNNGELPYFNWRYRTVESGDEWVYDECLCPYIPDFNPPSLNVTIVKKGFFFWKKYVVTACATDCMSGMDYVDFFLNGQLVGNITGPGPLYVWTLKPVPRGHNLTFTVWAYDVAGNSNGKRIFKPNVYPNGENSLPRENLTVTITFPENGIYWNTTKIAQFSVPLILSGDGFRDGNLIWTPVKYKVEGEVDGYSIWWNGVMEYNGSWTPGCNYSALPMSRFSHGTFKIVVYSTIGDSSAEITIWRLFL